MSAALEQYADHLKVERSNFEAILADMRAGRQTSMERQDNGALIDITPRRIEDFERIISTLTDVIESIEKKTLT